MPKLSDLRKKLDDTFGPSESDASKSTSTKPMGRIKSFRAKLDATFTAPEPKKPITPAKNPLDLGLKLDWGTQTSTKTAEKVSKDDLLFQVPDVTEPLKKVKDSDIVKTVVEKSRTAFDMVRKVNEELKKTKTGKMADAAIKFATGKITRDSLLNKATGEAVIRASNTETGQKAILKALDATSNLGIKSEAARIGAKTALISDKPFREAYDAAYAAMKAKSEDPNNNIAEQIFWGFQDSGLQSMVGMAISAAVGYATKNPAAAMAVSMPFYGMLSAGEQIKETGKVYSWENIQIDTIGDMLIGGVLAKIFSAPAKTLAKTLLESGATEGITEPLQTLMKYANDYRNAKSDEERARIMKDAKYYITSGAILVEAGVGALSGTAAGGGTYAVDAMTGRSAEASQDVANLGVSVPPDPGGPGGDGPSGPGGGVVKPKEEATIEPTAPKPYKPLFSEPEVTIDNSDQRAMGGGEPYEVIKIGGEPAYEIIDNPYDEGVAIHKIEDGTFVMNKENKTSIFNSVEEAREALKKEIGENYIPEDYEKSPQRFVEEYLNTHALKTLRGLTNFYENNTNARDAFDIEELEAEYIRKLTSERFDTTKVNYTSAELRKRAELLDDNLDEFDGIVRQELVDELNEVQGKLHEYEDANAETMINIPGKNASDLLDIKVVKYSDGKYGRRVDIQIDNSGMSGPFYGASENRGYAFEAAIDEAIAWIAKQSDLTKTGEAQIKKIMNELEKVYPDIGASVAELNKKAEEAGEDITLIDDEINKAEQYDEGRETSGGAEAESQPPARPEGIIKTKKSKKVDPKQKLPSVVIDESEPVHESKQPSREKWGKEVENYLTNLGEYLGWFPDHDEKGKKVKIKMNHDYVYAIFWKPGSKYGVYVTISSYNEDDVTTKTVMPFMYRVVDEKNKFSGYQNIWEGQEGITIEDFATKMKMLATSYEKAEASSAKTSLLQPLIDEAKAAASLSDFTSAATKILAGDEEMRKNLILLAEHKTGNPDADFSMGLALLWDEHKKTTAKPAGLVDEVKTPERITKFEDDGTIKKILEFEASDGRSLGIKDLENLRPLFNELGRIPETDEYRRILAKKYGYEDDGIYSTAGPAFFNKQETINLYNLQELDGFLNTLGNPFAGLSSVDDWNTKPIFQGKTFADLHAELSALTAEKKPAGLVDDGKKPEKKKGAKEAFSVGDLLHTQGNTNMADPVEIREIEGNTLKFTDANGTEYSGMSQATVRGLVEAGSWVRVEAEKPAGLTDDKKSATIKSEQTYEKPGRSGLIQKKTDEKGLSKTEGLGARGSARPKTSTEVAGGEVSRRGYYISDDSIRERYGSVTAINAKAEELLNEKGGDPSKYTAEEKRILSLYSGAGGLESQGAEGRGLLDEYYTPQKIARFVWQEVAKLKDLTKNGLTIIEPSIGTGVFAHLFPGSTRFNEVIGYEINPVSARIASLLNPKAMIYNSPFESNFITENGKKIEREPIADIVIGNPPYGDHRGKYKGLGEEPRIGRYEEYFIKRSLDLTTDGGIVAMVVPSGFLRSGKNYAKEAIARNGILIDAYRLPNGAFPTTQIGTDIVFFQKNPTTDEGSVSSRVFRTTDDNYFLTPGNEDRIIGQEKERKGRFGLEKYVEGDLEDLPFDRVETEEQATTETEGVPAEDFKDMEKSAEAANVEIVAAEEEKRAEETKELIDSGPKPTDKFTIHYDNRDQEVVYHQSGVSELEHRAWVSTQADGSLTDDFTKTLSEADRLKYFSFYAGRWYLDFNYLQGNLYAKLKELEDKRITPAQRAKQKKLIEDVLPPKTKIKDIDLDVRAPFTVDIKIGEVTLRTAFRDFIVSSMPREAFGDLTRSDITGYVDGEPVRGNDKERNQYVRENRGRVANDLFRGYIESVLTDEQRAEIERSYNETFNGYYYPDYTKVPILAPTLKKLAGTNKEFRLNEAQRRVIGFMVSRGVGINALDVGVGKTFSTVIALQEIMARGWSKRPVIVVEKNTYRQWLESIKQMLPEARVNDWYNLGSKYDKAIANGTLKPADGTITLLTYQGFSRLRFKDATYTAINSKFSDSVEIPGKKTKRQEQSEYEKVAEIEGRIKKGTKDIYFENLGFDHLTIDEAQNFNHVVSSSRKVDSDSDDKVSDEFQLRMNPSSRGLLSWYASQYIQDNNGGRNVFLLSATPFTNNPLEYYSILSLVGYNKLSERGVENVNEFLTTFMELEDAPAFTIDGQFRITKQIKAFRNVNELKSLIDELILFVDGEEAGVIRPKKTTKRHQLKRTPLQTELFQEINGEIKKLTRKEDAGKRLAMFGRLVQTTLSPFLTKNYSGPVVGYKEFVEGSPKIRAMMEVIRQNQKDAKNGRQIVFCPYVEVGESGLNIHNLIREYLIKELGFKNNEVGIINGAVSDDARELVKKSFNEGSAKIVIGSSAIMRGVNLQQRTTDIHVLVLPWNYEDLRQLSGRAWRQGNRYANVRVRQYLLEDSGDIFVSQKLAVKEARAKALMSLKGDIKNNKLDAGLITFSEALNNLVTDPVMRTQMGIEGDRRDVARRLSLAISNRAFLTKKLGLEKLEEIDNEIKQEEGRLEYRIENYKDKEKWAETDEFYRDRLPTYREEITDTEKEINKLKKKKEAILKEREELGLDISQVVQADEQVRELTKAKEGLEETAKAKMTEAIAEAALKTEVAEENDYGQIAKDVAIENSIELDFADWYRAEAKARGTKLGSLALTTGANLGGYEKVEITQPGEARKIYDFTVALTNKYAKKLGQGYLPSRKAGGAYFSDTQNIRVSGYNALSFVAHEIAHFIDFHFRISSRIMKEVGKSTKGNPIYDPKTRPYRKEITRLYEEYYIGGKRTHPLRQRAEEGFATLLQKYLEMPNTIAAQYPNLVNDFLKPKGKYYEETVGQLIAEVQAYMAGYQGLEALDKIGVRVVTDKVNVEKESFFGLYDKTRSVLTDYIYPAEKIARIAGTGFTSKDFSLYARLYNNINSIIFSNFRGKRGYWQLNPESGNLVKKAAFNWRSLMEWLEQYKVVDSFGNYLVARNQYFTFLELKDAVIRVEQLKEEIEQVGGPVEASKVVGDNGKSLLDEFKAAVETANRLNRIIEKDGFTFEEVSSGYLDNQGRFAEMAAMYDKLVAFDLEYLHATQLITTSQFEKLSSREGYASMKRDFTDQLLGDEFITQRYARLGGTKVSSLIAREGSARPIINPLYSGLTNHAEITKKGTKQIVFNKMLNIYGYFPDVFQRLELVRAKDKDGRIIYPQEKDPRIIMARSNFKRVPILVQDDLVLQSLIEVMTYEEIGLFEKIVRAAARFFTKGTTGLYAPFTFTNYPIDQVTASANTRNNYIPIYDSLAKVLPAVLSKSGQRYEYFQEYLIMGGDRQTMIGWQDLSPRELSKVISNEREGILKALDMINQGLDILGSPSKYSEIMTRAAEYIKAREAGKSSVVALEEAGRVSAPFHHIGSLGGKVGQAWVRSIPFFNPLIQVLAQTASTAHTKGGRQRIAFVTLLLMAMIIGSFKYLRRNATDEQKELYYDIDPEQLGQYIYFPSPNGKSLIQIRVPEQMGWLGAIANMWLSRQEGNYDAGDFIAAATQWLPRQINITKPAEAVWAWVPQIIKPAGLVAANIRDFPSIRPLESESQRRKLPELRSNESTSRLAKFLGQKLKMSPIKIDFLIQGYLGRATGLITGKPGGFNPFRSMSRQYYFSYGRNVSNFYEIKERNDQEYTAAKKGQKKYSPEEYGRIMKQHEQIKTISTLLDEYRDLDIEMAPDAASALRKSILDQISQL